MKKSKRNHINILLLSIFFVVTVFSSVYSQDGTEQSTYEIYVVSHAWHSGIAMEKEIWDAYGGIKFRNLPDFPYLEIGWGDAKYFPSRGFSLWLAFRALFWPTESVVHVSGFHRSPVQALPSDRIQKLLITENDIKQLIAAINEEVESSKNESGEVVATGLYGQGLFYKSKSSYHIFHTCNVWTARKLSTANIPVSPWRSITVRSLMKQLSD